MRENEQRLQREHEEIRRRFAEEEPNEVLFPLRKGRSERGSGSRWASSGGSSSRDPALLKTVMAVLPEASMAARSVVI